MRRILLLMVFALIIGTGSLFAQRGGRSPNALEVKLGSPLPQASPWGRTLDRIASEWNRVTNGQVRLNVRHGGIEGSESKMHLSLASNSIQAAGFTSIGLSVINPSILTMSAPFLIRNERELEAVMNEVQGDLERKINSSDYFIVAWSKSGFINIFSKEPVFSPDDLRKQRIASNPDTEDINAAFKTMGFQVVEMDWTEVGQKLAAGQVMAAYQNPAGVAAYQLHTVLKNMMSLNIAPVLGGIVINQVTWRRIGELNPRYQEELVRVTRRLAGELDGVFQKTVGDAIQAMSREGLIINRPSPQQEQLWYNDMEKATPVLMQLAYDRELYQKVSDFLAKYRAQQ